MSGSTNAKIFRILILVILIIVVMSATIGLVYHNYGKVQLDIIQFHSAEGNGLSKIMTSCQKKGQITACGGKKSNRLGANFSGELILTF